MGGLGGKPASGVTATPARFDARPPYLARGLRGLSARSWTM
ncbi:MAG: hypothetical protein QOE90_413 [Thermoplasmata archaeon]|jgi:hypothetical protein|nr:hypothetical protein [Thermoplasmata archaeon]